MKISSPSFKRSFSLVRFILIGVITVGLEAHAAERPNVVLIMADDMGYECLSTYGSLSYETPRLDQLAEQGIRFEHCYSTPVCTTSRVQIMTGRYNCFTYEEFGYLNPKYPTFGNLMQDAGYATMIAGKWQLNGISHGEGKFARADDATRLHDAGFDEYSLWQLTKGKAYGERFWDPYIEQNGESLDEVLDGKYGPDHFTNYICDFIERKKDEPFFVYYPMVLVHSPTVRTPDSPDVELSKQEAFSDMVAYCDKLVGRILDKLEEEGVLENTLVIFTADNGTDRGISSELPGRTVPGGKANTIDGGIHVPLIAYWQGRTPVGSKNHQLVDFTDFYQTLADIVELPRSERDALELDGVSLWSALQGKPGPTRDWVFGYYDARWGQARTHRDKYAYDGRFKLYQNGDLFEVSTDFMEEAPATAEGTETMTREKLQAVLDRYPRLPDKETEFGESLLP